ncbi:DEAD-family helicase, partial [Cardiosporidium cionae]
MEKDSARRDTSVRNGLLADVSHRLLSPALVETKASREAPLEKSSAGPLSRDIAPGDIAIETAEPSSKKIDIPAVKDSVSAAVEQGGAHEWMPASKLDKIKHKKDKKRKKGSSKHTHHRHRHTSSSPSPGRDIRGSLRASPSLPSSRPYDEEGKSERSNPEASGGMLEKVDLAASTYQREKRKETALSERDTLKSSFQKKKKDIREEYSEDVYERRPHRGERSGHRTSGFMEEDAFKRPRSRERMDAERNKSEYEGTSYSKRKRHVSLSPSIERSVDKSNDGSKKIRMTGKSTEEEDETSKSATNGTFSSKNNQKEDSSLLDASEKHQETSQTASSKKILSLEEMMERKKKEERPSRILFFSKEQRTSLHQKWETEKKISQEKREKEEIQSRREFLMQEEMERERARRERHKERETERLQREGERKNREDDERKRRESYNFKDRRTKSRQDESKSSLASLDLLNLPINEMRARQQDLDPNKKHWTEKDCSEMTERDWRIFREDFEIYLKGGRVPPPIRTWAESPLSWELLEAIRKAGYDRPTPIQMQALPIALEQRDLIGIAET